MMRQKKHRMESNNCTNKNGLNYPSKKWNGLESMRNSHLFLSQLYNPTRTNIKRFITYNGVVFFDSRKWPFQVTTRDSLERMVIINEQQEQNS